MLWLISVHLCWQCIRWSRWAYPESSEDDAGDLFFDRLLQNVGEGGHHVVAAQLLTQLRAEGQKPDAEDHLVLQLEATLVTQHCCNARRSTAHILVMHSHFQQVHLQTSTLTHGRVERLEWRNTGQCCVDCNLKWCRWESVCRFQPAKMMGLNRNKYCGETCIIRMTARLLCQNKMHSNTSVVSFVLLLWISV